MQVAIVGAGVVGVACAAQLARAAGHSVFVIESDSRAGTGISARNSQVIHAGLYYAAGSLKAATCVRGRQLLYERCAQRHIAHRRCGKLIVITAENERPRLEALAARAQANGADDIRVLDATEIRRIEPRVRAIAALMSPETGVVDAHALVQNYQLEAERHGAQFVWGTRVQGLARRAGGWAVHCASRDDPTRDRCELEVDAVVNAAGLGAVAVAAAAGLDTRALGWRLHPCKGDYFNVHRSLGRLTERLVYPLPDAAGLGVHVTFDLQGAFRLGPDTTYLEPNDSPADLDYHVDADKSAQFAAAASRFLPDIRATHLAPDYAGIRPKLQGPGKAARDFVIEEASAHGAPGLVNLLGIESPGLTAAGAIAERVAALLFA